jgi:hypothetical protein
MMMPSNSILLKFVATFLLFLLSACADQQASKTKVMRPNQQRSLRFLNSAMILDQGSPNLRTMSAKSKLSRGSENVKQAVNIQSIAVAARDEVVDIVDSIVFARTNSERLSNTLDVLQRHKVILGVGAIGCFAKWRFLGKRGALLGKDILNDLRKAEVEKWGARALGR